MSFRLGVLALLGLAAFAIPAIAVAGVEEPPYAVESTVGDVELRAYAPMIRAETVVRGPYDEALNEGFRVLAGYIFGGNAGSRKIAMTAPVGAEPAPGEKIAMTAPVGAEPTAEGWRVSFVMPVGYTLETLPRPLDPRVTLRELPAHRVAALRFSGWASERRVAEQRARLLAALEARGLAPADEPVIAQYNPPWTVPFLRRNEILVALR